MYSLLHKKPYYNFAISSHEPIGGSQFTLCRRPPPLTRTNSALPSPPLYLIQSRCAAPSLTSHEQLFFVFWYCLLDLEDIFFTGFHITDVDFAALRNLLK